MQEALKNSIVEGMIEECLIDRVSPRRFPSLLHQALVSTITVRRHDAPDLVAILNDSEALRAIATEYDTQYKAQYPEGETASWRGGA